MKHLINGKEIDISWEYSGAEYSFDISKVEKNYKEIEKCRNCEKEEEECDKCKFIVKKYDLDEGLDGDAGDLCGIVTFKCDEIGFAKIKLSYLIDDYDSIEDVCYMDSLFAYLNIKEIKDNNLNCFGYLKCSNDCDHNKDEDYDYDDDNRFNDPTNSKNKILKNSYDLIDYLGIIGFDSSLYAARKMYMAITEELISKGYNYVYEDMVPSPIFDNDYRPRLRITRNKIESKKYYSVIDVATKENDICSISTNDYDDIIIEQENYRM